MQIQAIHIVLILLLPIAGCVSILLINNKKLSGWMASGFSFLVFTIAILLWVFWTTTIYKKYDWFQVGDFQFHFGLLLDKMSVIMLVVVSLITLLVNIFSIEYMKNDEGKNRYFACLGLFAFSMYGVVLSSNLFLTFFFWESVGFTSYLLIGFWFQKEEPPKASLKAFMLNRIGDAGFLIALLILFAYFKTFELPVLYKVFASNQSLLTSNITMVLGLGLFLGAVGKSAQFPLQNWLPDAMAGPTPVSALIHAATMVAAGVFMMIRVFPMLSEPVLLTITIIGSITAFMGAFAAFAQNDIKKVLAYSTISQLGYMMMAIGTGSPKVAFFHLITHAFFKAGLFLCAGIIIHKMHENYKDNENINTQDMLNMGGLRSNMPLTFIAYTIATLALCGLPFFSGFYSKDAILSSTFYWSLDTSSIISFMIPFVAFLTVFMTAAYMGRQYFMVFFGKQKHESKLVDWKEPKLMTIPTIILSILSLWFWYDFNPIGIGGEFITRGLLPYIIIETAVHTFWISIISVLLGLMGLTTAFILYYHNKTKILDWIPKGIQSLSENHWFLDSFQDKVVVRPVKNISRYSDRFDRKIIDGAVNGIGILNVVVAYLLGWFDRHVIDGLVNFSAYISAGVGNMTRNIQGGKIQNYFVWAIVGILLIYIFVF